MKSGTTPTRIKIKDYDFLPSFHPGIYAGTAPLPQFPAEYLTDQTDWLPNQNTDGFPEGCTDYAQTKLARILGTIEATPQMLENVTHANTLGGFGILASVDAARTVLKWFTWRYIIQSTGALDYFDTCRLAQVSGIPERRAISSGSPWFPSWEKACLSGVKIMPMPTQDELTLAHTNPNALPWHDYVLDGWSQNFPVSPGQLLYRGDSWQGDIDYVYFPREVINVVFDLYGTVQVVPTNMGAPTLASVPIPAWFASLLHSLFGFSY